MKCQFPLYLLYPILPSFAILGHLNSCSFQNAGQSWHHSWEKWYYLWGFFENHEILKVFITKEFKYSLMIQKSNSVGPTLFFKNQTLCSKMGCEPLSTLVLIMFSKKKKNFANQSTLVLIMFSKMGFQTLINPRVDLIFQKWVSNHYQPSCWSPFQKWVSNHYQPLCWSYLPKIGFETLYSKINPCVDLIFQKIWFQIIIFKDQPLCWSYLLKLVSKHYIQKINPCVDLIISFELLFSEIRSIVDLLFQKLDFKPLPSKIDPHDDLSCLIWRISPRTDHSSYGGFSSQKWFFTYLLNKHFPLKIPRAGRIRQTLFLKILSIFSVNLVVFIGCIHFIFNFQIFVNLLFLSIFVKFYQFFINFIKFYQFYSSF